ncbi:MAG TPA: VCBS repeat-containing protein [bacterium]|nr:VCBS repeat-containing protein [bacterium]
MRTFTGAAAAVLSMLCAVGPGSAADFDGDSREDIAVFRPSTGLWAVRGLTRVYFGTSGDTPAAGDFTGDGVAEIGIFRPAAGLWSIRGVSRIYFGQSNDTALTGGGGGQRLYDYVVKPDDGDDLEDALSSDVYRSVFIPAGNYAIDEVVTVDHVTRIVGEDRMYTSLNFANDCYLSIDSPCTVEGLRLYWGGIDSTRGNLCVRGSYATVRNCISETSTGYGFQHADGYFVSFIDCIASQSSSTGFRGSNDDGCRFVNCLARSCVPCGFAQCRNLANCYVDGYGSSTVGFYECERLSTCHAYGCSGNGFYGCSMISSCSVDGNSVTVYGFQLCSYLSSCHAENCVTASFYDNYFTDDAATKYSCN